MGEFKKRVDLVIVRMTRFEKEICVMDRELVEAVKVLLWQEGHVKCGVIFVTRYSVPSVLRSARA